MTYAPSQKITALDVRIVRALDRPLTANDLKYKLRCDVHEIRKATTRLVSAGVVTRTNVYGISIYERVEGEQP